jgi:hypothetical protein
MITAATTPETHVTAAAASPSHDLSRDGRTQHTWRTTRRQAASARRIAAIRAEKAGSKA